MPAGAFGETGATLRRNLADPAFTFDPDDPPGFRSGMARLGPGLGAEQTGATLYELPPGEALCPHHDEHAEEEWALVLSGTPPVPAPPGTESPAPLALVFFPRGPDGAHQLRNDAGTPARVLLWSNVSRPAVTVCPDSDKVGVRIRGGADDLIAERSSGVPCFRGEAPGA